MINRKWFATLSLWLIPISVLGFIHTVKVLKMNPFSNQLAD